MSLSNTELFVSQELHIAVRLQTGQTGCWYAYDPRYAICCDSYDMLSYVHSAETESMLIVSCRFKWQQDNTCSLLPTSRYSNHLIFSMLADHACVRISEKLPLTDDLSKSMILTIVRPARPVLTAGHRAICQSLYPKRSLLRLLWPRYVRKLVCECPEYDGNCLNTPQTTLRRMTMVLTIALECLTGSKSKVSIIAMPARPVLTEGR